MASVKVGKLKKKHIDNEHQQVFVKYKKLGTYCINKIINLLQFIYLFDIKWISMKKMLN